MAKINVFVQCDSNGVALDKPVTDIKGIFNDVVVVPRVDMSVVITMCDISQDSVRDLYGISSSISVVTEPWLAKEVIVHLLADEHCKDIFITVISVGDSYKDILELDGDITLYTIAKDDPNNTPLYYRGWSPEECMTAIYDTDGSEYVMTAYRKCDDLDMSDDDMMDEIDRMESELNKPEITYTDDERRKIKSIVGQISSGWQLTRMMGNVPDSSMEDDPKLDGGPELDDDIDSNSVFATNDGSRIFSQDTYATADTVERTVKHFESELDKLFYTQKVTAETITMITDRINDLQNTLEQNVDGLESTRHTVVEALSRIRKRAMLIDSKHARMENTIDDLNEKVNILISVIVAMALAIVCMGVIMYYAVV